MQENNNARLSPKGLLGRLWAARRSFRGFGLLLFYCHMLMLFSVLARVYLADLPDCALLLQVGRFIVPVLFSLTTFSLFWPWLFWAGAVLGLAHLPFAAVMLAGAPIAALPWFVALTGLLVLLLVSIKWKISGRN